MRADDKFGTSIVLLATLGAAFLLLQMGLCSYGLVVGHKTPYLMHALEAFQECKLEGNAEACGLVNPTRVSEQRAARDDTRIDLLR